jgi:dihydroneopterin aldolase
VREQDLVVNIQVWTDLRAGMSRHISQCDILEVQKQRADAADWDKHAAGELAGTVNYSSLAKIAKKVCIEGKFFTIEAMAQCIARLVIVECDAGKVQVNIDKPEALAKKGVRAAACQVDDDAAEKLQPFCR